MVSSTSLSLLLLPSYAFAAFNLLNVSEDVPQLPLTGDNEACLAAYNTTIDCDEAILQVGTTNDLPTEKELDSICTNTCLNSLRKWVRGGPGCEGEAFFGFFGLYNGTAEIFGGPATAADLQQYWIFNTYHRNCLVSLNPKPEDPKYCLQINATVPEEQYLPAYLDVSNPDKLCKDNTCAAQAAYLMSPLNSTYLYDSTGKKDISLENGMTTYEGACPEGNTSGFPKREKDITIEDLDSAGEKPLVVGGSSNGGDDSNQPTDDDNETPTDNENNDASTTGTDGPSSTGQSGSRESSKPNAAAGGNVVELGVFASAAFGAILFMLV